MDKSQQLLSDIIIYNKYAKHNTSKNRRETWGEIVDRYIRMMIEKYGTNNDVLTWDYYNSNQDVKEGPMYSSLAQEIVLNSFYLKTARVLPSMRASQFAGEAIKKNHARIYNCAYAPIDHPAVFSEIMFLLLGGTGVGYSVQKDHVDKLPEIHKGVEQSKFLIGDSIEGWADSIKALMYWGFGKRKHRPRFDYSDIRPKGARLVTAGGKAPGAGPLRIALAKIESILETKENGSKLTPLEVHDIICHIADAVLAGGIRRAALISLFSFDDEEMKNSKKGNWWELNPQRGRANNSAVALRYKITKEAFVSLFKEIEESFSGEPGIYLTNNPDYGTNPCGEIALRPYQFCNLTETNAGDIKESVKQAFIRNNSHIKFDDEMYKANASQVGEAEQEELNQRSKVAAFFGTLQAGFTDFHYLRPIWKTTTEKDALVGVGMTGIANGDVLSLDLSEAALVAVKENERVAEIIGINKAARVTTVKPSGTTSCVAGCSSGIHAWHSKFYIRAIQCAYGDELYTYFTENHPKLIKKMEQNPNTYTILIPQKAPEGAILREDENALSMTARVFKFYDEWVKVGHRSGANTNNVSATVYVDADKRYDLGMLTEWEALVDYLWDNKNKFNGISVLPYDGGSYKDAPFQEIDEARYNELMLEIETNPIDLTKIVEIDDNTTLASELACAGDNCVII